MEQNRKPQNKPTQLWTINLGQKRQGIRNGEKTVFSISDAGKTEQVHIKKKLEHFLVPYTKINSK